MKAALYARVSTLDQEPENQLAEVRQYAGSPQNAARVFQLGAAGEPEVHMSSEDVDVADAVVNDPFRGTVQQNPL